MVAILADVTIEGARTSLAALSLTPHTMAPVAELPVLEIVSSVHMICDFTQPATPSPGPDFSGIWNRVGNLWLDPIPGDDRGKPVSRLKVDRPGADGIWAGDFNNPILQPWAREVVKKNA
jgi:hypothetical protein